MNHKKMALRVNGKALMESDWTAVRIFISSTFRDMHADCDLLRNDAFLELNERLRPRHHELNVIRLLILSEACKSIWAVT